MIILQIILLAIFSFITFHVAIFIIYISSPKLWDKVDEIHREPSNITNFSKVFLFILNMKKINNNTLKIILFFKDKKNSIIRYLNTHVK